MQFTCFIDDFNKLASKEKKHDDDDDDNDDDDVCGKSVAYAIRSSATSASLIIFQNHAMLACNQRVIMPMVEEAMQLPLICYESFMLIKK